MERALGDHTTLAGNARARRLPPRSTVQQLLDLFVVSSGWLLALVVANITIQDVRSDQRSVALAVIATAMTLAIMQRRGLYEGRPTLPRTEEISRVFVAVVGGAASITVTAAFLDWHIGAWEIITGGIGVFAGRTLIRGVVRTLGTELPSTNRPTRIVVVGTGHEAKELVELIDDHPEARFEIAGVVGNLGVAERSGLADHWIGPTGRLIELMHQHQVAGAVVTSTGFRGEQFRNITRELFGSGYDVHLTTGVSRMWEGRFDVRSLSHEPLIVVGKKHTRRWQLWVKRAMDIAGATIALILASPVMGITALAIWLEDRGPVTYSARRAGRRGDYFAMHKFRSMVTNADELKAEMAQQNERTGPLFKVSNDPRITRVGRWIRETSIDELPQLYNVIKGDMSLVGPRPALPEEEAVFDEELRERFKVRPGITGLWQVEARSNAAFNAYRRLDLHYVENWNLGLDLRILLATAEQVIVTIALIPLRLIRRRAADHTDGIAVGSSATSTDQQAAPDELETGADSLDDVVIDLRRRNRERMALLASVQEQAGTSSDPVLLEDTRSDTAPQNQ